MDINKTNIPINDDVSTSPSQDDVSMLQSVLESVKGSYPAGPYRQTDFIGEQD